MPDFRQPSFHGLIGIAREEITPPVGIHARNWPTSEHDVIDEVHRPLTATAMVVYATPNSEPLILISLDLGWWRRKEDEWYLRGHLIEHLHVDPSRLIVCLSHTHAGPSISLDDTDKPGGNLVRPYMQLVRDKLVEVVRDASRTAVPATLTWTYGRCRLARNRDQFVPELGRFVYGFDEKLPSDSVLLVGKIVSDAGNNVATIVNYACHPTSIGWESRAISPDFVGAMRELVEDHVGGICMFLQGAAGEMAPRDQYSSDAAIADRNGRELGYAVLSTLESMLPPGYRSTHAKVVGAKHSLGVWEYAPDKVSSHVDATIHTVELPLKTLSTVEEIERKMRVSDDREMLERLHRERQVRHTVGNAETVRLPLWSWAIGDALFLACPGEPYTLLQRQLRLHFVERAVCVLNVANGWYGYLPPWELYEKEVPTVHQTPFAKGSLEALVKAGVTELERMCRSATHSVA